MIEECRDVDAPMMDALGKQTSGSHLTCLIQQYQKYYKNILFLTVNNKFSQLRTVLIPN